MYKIPLSPQHCWVYTRLRVGGGSSPTLHWRHKLSPLSSRTFRQICSIQAEKNWITCGWWMKWLLLVFCVISETASNPGETDSQLNGMRLKVRFDKNKNRLLTGIWNITLMWQQSQMCGGIFSPLRKCQREIYRLAWWLCRRCIQTGCVRRMWCHQFWAFHLPNLDVFVVCPTLFDKCVSLWGS